jgi:hypothetical protein
MFLKAFTLYSHFETRQYSRLDSSQLDSTNTHGAKSNCGKGTLLLERPKDEEGKFSLTPKYPTPTLPKSPVAVPFPVKTPMVAIPPPVAAPVAAPDPKPPADPKMLLACPMPPPKLLALAAPAPVPDTPATGPALAPVAAVETVPLPAPKPPVGDAKSLVLLLLLPLFTKKSAVAWGLLKPAPNDPVPVADEAPPKFSLKPAVVMSVPEAVESPSPPPTALPVATLAPSLLTAKPFPVPDTANDPRPLPAPPPPAGAASVVPAVALPTPLPPPKVTPETPGEF